jgi:VanZ family protein
VIVYLAAISILSHQPALRPPVGAPDWLMHMLEYGGLGALVGRALSSSPSGLSRSRAMWGAAACAAFGLIDEWHQSFVPGRHAGLEDVAADAFGATVALSAWMLASWRRNRSRATGAALIEIRIFGRQGCLLCEEADHVLREVAAEYPVHLETLDVDEDEDLRRMYGDEVPVVTIDGRKLFKLRVDPVRLRRVLDSVARRRTS